MKQLEASLPEPACIVIVLHHAYYTMHRTGMECQNSLVGTLGIITYYMIPFPNSFFVDFVA